MQKELKDIIIKELTKIYFKNGSDIHLEQLAATNNSDIYLASCLNVKKQVLVKRVLSGDYEDQLASLIKTSLSMSDSCLTPQYLGSIDKDNIIFMDYIDGNDFHSILLSGCSRSDKINLASKAGHWLACYHNKLNVGKNKISAKEKLNNFKEKNIQIIHAAKKHTLIHESIDWLQRHTEAVEFEAVDWGGYHGDFKPENILLSTKGIYGIDFIISEDSYQLMDLAQFSNHLLFLGINKFGYRVLKFRHELIDSFIYSYSQARNNISLIALKWLRIEHLLRYYIDEYTKNSISSTIQGWFIGYEIRQLLRSLK